MQVGEVKFYFSDTARDAGSSPATMNNNPPYGIIGIIAWKYNINTSFFARDVGSSPTAED